MGAGIGGSSFLFPLSSQRFWVALVSLKPLARLCPLTWNISSSPLGDDSGRAVYRKEFKFHLHLKSHARVWLCSTVGLPREGTGSPGRDCPPSFPACIPWENGASPGPTCSSPSLQPLDRETFLQLPCAAGKGNWAAGEGKERKDLDFSKGWSGKRLGMFCCVWVFQCNVSRDCCQKLPCDIGSYTSKV